MKTKPFNLEEYLANPSRKIVTRGGENVRIICTDGNNESFPILGFIDNHICVGLWNTGGYYDPGYTSDLDLFFLDESEDELTELQKTLEEDCDYYVNLYNDGKTRKELREWIKAWCHRIIDLARKQLKHETIEALQTEYEKDFQEGVKEGRRLGRKDIDSEFSCLDESEKLTEFEDALVQFAHDSFDSLLDVTKGDALSRWKDKLLDIASKQIKEERWKQELRKYQQGYEQGKIDVLKDLPKWKTAMNMAFGSSKDKYFLVRTSFGYYLTNAIAVDEKSVEYLELTDLEKLPKEE